MSCPVLLRSLVAVLPALVVGVSSLRGAQAAPVPREVQPLAVHPVLKATEQPEAYRYLAFPALLRVSEDEVWLSAKAGARHAADAGAALEVLSHRISTATTQRVQRLAAPAPKLYQMGEFARLPDGTIALHVDVQEVGHDSRHYRVGQEWFRWDPARKAFAGPEAFPVVSGITYGYPFDFVTEGTVTWQLSMTFGYQPGRRWSVDALRSDDSGRTWQFVRNLSAEFGDLRINESAFIRYGDGFIVTTRGYDSKERLHRTDLGFRQTKGVTLTGAYPFINSYIGRPRIWVRDGHGYMLGRNRTTSGAKMQLALLRFDPETLAVTGCAILDNHANENVTDGYYAMAVYGEREGRTLLHVFTYKGRDGAPCDLLRLDYLWDEVK